jgi:hypothetical protein
MERITFAKMSHGGFFCFKPATDGRVMPTAHDVPTIQNFVEHDTHFISPPYQ